MSIFDIFRPAQPSQGQPQPAPGGNQHVQANNQVPNSTNTPTQQPTPENPTPASPNDKFKDLWQPSAQAENSAPNFKLSPDQLAKVTGQMDFTRSITPDAMAKVFAGGEDAVQALQSILNVVGREAFSNAAQFTSHMTESGYAATNSSVQRTLPDLVRKQNASNEMFAANPALRDPAYQPLVQAMQSQFATKFPSASPSELNAMVQEYFTNLPGLGKQQEAPAKTGPQDQSFNFASFLN